MNKKEHLYVNGIVLIGITILLILYKQSWISIIFLLFSVYWGALFPDTDQIPKSSKAEKVLYEDILHRNWFTHSIILTTVIFTLSLYYNEPNFTLFSAYMNLGIGLHLLADCKVRRSKMIGTYTVKFLRFRGDVKGLNGIQSTLWLVLNFLISVLVFIMTCGVV